MIKAFVVFVCISLICVCEASSVDDYGRAFKIESSRQGSLMFRYIKNYENPCLEVQVLDPAKGWRLLSQKKICALGERSLVDDVVDAIFENIVFVNGRVLFNLRIIPLDLGGDEIYACVIEVKETIFDEMECSAMK